MATAIWKPWRLVIGGTAYPFAVSDLSLGNDLKKEELQLAGHTKLTAQVVHSRMPFIRVTMTDPTAFTDWDGDSSATAIFRAIDEDDTYGSTYKSFAFSKAVIVPRRLRAELGSGARMELDIFGLFDSGVAYTVGTTSGVAATFDHTYIPKQLVLGSNTLAAGVLQSANIDWDWGDIITAGTPEPEWMAYDKKVISGEFRVRDLAEATAARLDDGGKETVCTPTFEDIFGAGADLSFTMGKVFVDVGTNEGDVVIKTQQVEATAT